MKKSIIFCISLAVWVSMTGLLQADSFRHTSGESTLLVQASENKAQPGVMMLLLDDPDSGPPPPAGSSPVLDTGLIKCYDNEKEIQCPWPGKPFYGQDAQYPGRARSYTKLGEHQVPLPDDELHIDAGGEWIMTKDNTTWLVWEVKTDANKDEQYDWDDARDQHISGLNCVQFGGLNNWRLPSKMELSTLVNAGNVSPAIDTQWFPKTEASRYWSSTTLADTSAWNVSFQEGYVVFSHVSIEMQARAVSAGFVVPFDLSDNNDGTVSDPNTELMWQKCNYGQEWNGSECEGEPVILNWEQALSYAEGLNWAGYSDWRLPNINELQTLVNNSTFGPAVHPPFNSENTESDRYWSSTTCSHDMSSARHVNFYQGKGQSSNKTISIYARAVRNEH